jgi:hypothetical protein
MTRVNHSHTNVNSDRKPNEETKNKSPLLDALNPLKNADKATLLNKKIEKAPQNVQITSIFFRKIPS